MDLFAPDAALTQWEQDLPVAQGGERLSLLLALAWHLRQRAPARAHAVGAELAPLLEVLAPPQAAVARARLLLVAAEGYWLEAGLDQADDLAAQALRLLDGVGGAPGSEAARADCRWLQAWIANDRGHGRRGGQLLDQAAGHARAAADPVRQDVIDAARAICAVFGDWQSARLAWQDRFSAGLDGLAPAAAGWISDYLGTAAIQGGEYGRAIGHLMRAYEAALACGQPRRAIIIAANIGHGFTCLNAHDAALEWMQRGLALARPTGWPHSIGMCLMQTAETLRLLGQRESAQALLREALQTLAPLSGSRAYAMALEYQGDLALDLGSHAAALDSFIRLAARGDALAQPDFGISARRGQAHALSHLGRAVEALEAAEAALALARAHGNPSGEIAALKVLAEIHMRHALPAPSGLEGADPAQHYLERALALAGAIDGYLVPGALLDALASRHAARGDYARAYAVARQAGVARDHGHQLQATNRAIAMQVQYQTERAQTEGEHHRQLAAAQAERAEVLAQTGDTLARLGAIGQEITAQLDAGAVLRVLDRQVHNLLDATHFSVFLLEPDGGHLSCAFGVEAGKALAPLRIAVSDPRANTARCLRERREILIEADGATPNLIPGTLPTRSLLFAPLRIGERVLGVMTVQSLQPRAYGERELLIFRNLCAYGAIALDNASAYRQVAATLRTLSATQEQLLEKNLELEQAYKALEEVSLTDQLTGLRNRRFFLQNVDADVAMSLRAYDHGLHRQLNECDVAAAKDLVFFMVDLDHFKEVNDRYGHAAGDSILVQMQERLREVFRESDYLIRWGGEEFLVLARATQRDDAHVVAERMRRAVAERDFVLPDGQPLPRTCSIGFCCFPFLPEQPRLLSWSQVVELADQGLYIAKRSGRNAWAALYSTAQTSADGIFARLMRQPGEALAEGQVRIVSNLPGPLVLGGERRRTGLSSDLNH
ncbi:diguanylate cyclase [Oxalobacteraceae bacterium A2-2]